MRRKKHKTLIVGMSLLLAVASVSCTTVEEIADDTQHIPNEKDTEERLPNLLKNQEFLHLVHKLNPDLDKDTLRYIAETIEKYGEKFNVPVNLIVSVIAAESNFHPRCQGTLDDTGLMQVRMKYAPYWAQLMGVKPPETREELLDIETNIQIGTFILKYLLNYYDHNLERVLVAYNAGQTYVDKKIESSLTLPKKYVNKVSQYHMELCNTPVTQALAY